jgi:hypothetical protein
MTNIENPDDGDNENPEWTDATTPRRVRRRRSYQTWSLMPKSKDETIPPIRSSQVNHKATDLPVLNVADRIYSIRGEQIILDRDLAAIYGCPVAKLMEQVSLKAHRFPTDFAFQLTEAEFNTIKSSTVADDWHRFTGTPPYALTEHGVVMIAGLLRNKRAVQQAIGIVRVFVRLRRAEPETAVDVTDFIFPDLSIQIMNYVRQHGPVTLDDMVKLTGNRRTVLKRHFRQLQAAGKLVLHGTGGVPFYALP